MNICRIVNCWENSILWVPDLCRMHLPTQTKWVCVCVYKQNAAPRTDKSGKCSAACFSLFSRQTGWLTWSFVFLCNLLHFVADSWFFLGTHLTPRDPQPFNLQIEYIAHQKQIHFTDVHAKQVTTRCSRFTARAQKNDIKGPVCAADMHLKRLKHLRPMGRCWCLIMFDLRLWIILNLV